MGSGGAPHPGGPAIGGAPIGGGPAGGGAPGGAPMGGPQPGGAPPGMSGAMVAPNGFKPSATPTRAGPSAAGPQPGGPGGAPGGGPKAPGPAPAGGAPNGGGDWGGPHPGGPNPPPPGSPAPAVGMGPPQVAQNLLDGLFAAPHLGHAIIDHLQTRPNLTRRTGDEQHNRSPAQRVARVHFERSVHDRGRSLGDRKATPHASAPRAAARPRADPSVPSDAGCPPKEPGAGGQRSLASLIRAALPDRLRK